MSALLVSIIVPFLFAIAVPFYFKWIRSIHTGWFVLPGPAVLFLYFLGHLSTIQEGASVRAELEWIPSLGISISVLLDGLSLLFALLISGIGALVVLYSIYYMDRSREAIHHFYVYLLLFMGAMLGVVLSDNLMVLYGFWELTSISSFLLIAFWNKREQSRYGARKSLLITVFGGLAMFAGFVLLYVMTGTFSIREIVGQAAELPGQLLFIPAMVLILLGAFTKSAQFPFHIWLPDAMEAPTPVSAYLHSATMVKAGLYLVARFSPVFAGQAAWFWLVSAVGLLTLVYASIRATRQIDLKAILAYSTISQLGLIMCLLGLGSASAAFVSDAGQASFFAKATTAAVFHLINHAVFKGALFMAVGIVDHETGTRDLRGLGGLIRFMPITFSITLLGAFSMAGIPPLGGFLSKEMFFTAVLNVQQMNIWNMESLGVLFPVIAWIASVFTFVYSMIVLFKTFTGKARPDKWERQPHEPALGMLIPPVVLVSLAVVFGFFPNLLSASLIAPAMAAILPGLLAPGDKFLVSIEMWHGWTMELLMTFGVVLVGFALYKLYGKRNRTSREQSSRFSLNGLYDGGLLAAHKASNRLTNGYMTGSIRHYLIYLFAFLTMSVIVTAAISEGISFKAGPYAPVSVYEIIVVLVLAAAALAVPFARNRLIAIIFTGAVGYMVVLLFVLFRAPDLALTQMIVETVSVALFLLCFYHLPRLRKEPSAPRFKAVNLVISLGVGFVVTLVALGASGSRSFETIADFYLRESYVLAGGKNVVNVILVDFRGFDTMLEIVVLGIAALAVYALISLRLAPPVSDGRLQAESPYLWRPKLERSNNVILRTISRVAVFVILIFSWYLFFAGHNQPGGGFIGGLMTASALVLLAISFGLKTVRQLIPIEFRNVIGIGLIIAFLTGIGSFAYNVPFLSHAFGYFDLPILGKTELATAVLFDLGVYLTVVGVTLTILFAIGRDDKSWN